MESIPDQSTDPLLVPTREEWEQMTAFEQDRRENQIIAALEKEAELMGETTVHFDSRASATEVLRRYFRMRGRTVFVASDLHTLYPGERAFYPDLSVVYDVEPHHRRSWNVMREGKGLDFVLEILSKQTRRKDQLEKVNLYARLQIPEYFLFDPDYVQLRGYRLEQNLYREIPEEDRKIYSEVLGLTLQVEEDKLRFALEGVDVPFADELLQQLNEKLARKDHVIVDYATELERVRLQAEEAEQREQEEQKRAEKEKKRADSAEERLAQMEEELRKLRKQVTKS